MTVRVLHIFSPDYKHRFGGPIFDWKYAFSTWNNPEVAHLVLDHDEKQLIDGAEAFDFELSSSQLMASRVRRATWVFSLIHNLSRFRADYDLIHFHILWWGGLLSATWAKWHKIPTIYQSVLLNEDTPSGILTQPLGKIKLNLLKNISLIFPISEPLRQDYLAHDFSQGQVLTLMNSVNSDLFHPINHSQEKFILRDQFNLPRDAIIIIFTGSLIKRKGVDLLVSAFVQASQRIPTLHLLLVGPKDANENPSLDPDFVEQLKVLISLKGLSGKVTFWGFEKDRFNLSRLYQASDLFVFPSLNEGLPNVVLEAMASGLPVVVSDLPVLKDIIVHHANGYVVPLEDVEALTQVLIDVVRDPIKAKELGRNAREYVLSHHTFSEWQETLSGHYKRLVDFS